MNYIGSAGGVFTVGDRFTFYNPQAVEAFEYPGAADQRRPCRAAGVGHQRER
jgi:hypothetical protein